MAGKSAAQTRNQNVLDIVLRLQYDRSSSAGIEEMKKEIARHQKLMPGQAMRFSVGKDNLSMAKKAGDKTGKAYREGMTAGIYGGGGKSGFGKNFAMDDFTMKSQQMRGVTTGLRHEVGKLRNTLLLVAFATAGVVTQFKAWFNVVLQTEAAMIGLKSVAIGTGIAFQQLKNYSLELEEKGFLSLRGSAAAQKNLAASHLALSEVRAVVAALTDAAAFNRQGTLSMEEAIVGATQGIKNQNSIMIDNAGITKNVSIMYREFAVALGRTAGSLTEQEKRQAITNGILKEAALFAGNAAKSMSTYQGKITKLNTMLLKTQRELGQIVAVEIITGLEVIAQKMSEIGGSDNLKVFVELIAKVTKNMMVLVSHFSSLGEGLSGTVGGGLGKALVSANAQFTIMAFLVYKVGRYLSGLGTKAKINSAAYVMHNKAAEKSMLKQAVIMKQNIIPKGRLRVRNAQDAAQVADITNSILAKGTAQQEIRINVEKRLQELYKIQNRSLQQNLEYSLLINQANMAGVKVIEKGAYIERKWKKGAFRPTQGYMREPGQAKTRVNTFGLSPLRGPHARAGVGIPASSFQEITSKPSSIKLADADTKLDTNSKHLQEWTKGNIAVSESAKMAMGTYQRLSYEIKQIGVNSVVAGKASMLFLGNMIKGGRKAIFAVNTLKTAILGIGAAIKGVISVMFNLLTKALIWYTTLTMIWDIYQDIFNPDVVESKERLKAIHLETIALEGLAQNYKEVMNEVNSKSQVFNTEVFDSPTINKEIFKYPELLGKSGRSVDALKRAMSGYLGEIEKLNKALLNKNLLKVDFDATMSKLEEFKTLYTSVYNEITEVNDKFNKSFETFSKSIKEMTNRFSLDISPLVKNVDKFVQARKALESDRSFLSTVSIPDSAIKAFKLGPDEQKAYYAGIKANELAYQLEMHKIIVKGEKAITTIIRKASEERLKVISDSSLKQLFTIKKGYDNTIMEAERGLSELKQRMANSELSKALAELDLNIKISQVETGIIEEANNIGDQIDFARGIINNRVDEMRRDLSVGIKEAQKGMQKVLNEFKSADEWAKEYRADKTEEFKGKEMPKFVAAHMVELDNKARIAYDKIMNLMNLKDSSEADSFQGFMAYLAWIVSTKGPLASVKEKFDDIATGGSASAGEVKAMLGRLSSITKTFSDFGNIKFSEKFNEELNRLDEDSDESINNIIQKIEKGIGNVKKTLASLAGAFSAGEGLGEGKKLLLNTFKNVDDMVATLFDESDERMTKLIENKKLVLKNTMEDFTYTDALIAKLDTTFESLSDSRGIDQVDQFLTHRESLLLTHQESTYKILRSWDQMLETSGLSVADKQLFAGFKVELEDFEAEKTRIAISQYWATLGKTYANEAAKFNRETRIKITEVDIIPTALGLDVGHRDLLGANYTDTMIEATASLGFLSDEYNEFAAAAYDKYWANMTKSIIEDTKEMTSAIMDGAFDMGKTLGDNFFKGIKVIKVSEQEAMKDMNEIFKQGEITEAERLDRKLQIHQYYASSMTYMWHNTAVDIGASMIGMVQEVIKQSAIAIAAQNAVNASTGSLGSILGAALGGAVPILGAVSIGLGLLTSAVSSRKIEQGQLEFESDTQNDMSKFGGTIKAEDVEINISPTFIIEGNQVFIGSGSVVEYVEEATELMKSGIQQSIDNKEFDLNAVKTAS